MSRESRVLERAIGESLADLLPEDRVLVACSGGADSLALAVAAAAAWPGVIAAVVDHGLRAESAEQARRTGRWLESRGIATVVRTVEVLDEGEGPEAAARVARYRELESQAALLDARAILLGHTRDDQAETVLLGLARGSGSRSIAGMPRRRGLLRRPFLALPRELVRAGVPEGAPVVDDPHNADWRYARARVRHAVLPVLERELGPGIVDALARTADLARADADALDDLAVAAAAEHGVLAGADVEIGRVADLPAAVLSRVVRRWLVASGCPAGSLTQDHLARTLDLVVRWKGQGAVALPGGVEALRDRGMLRVRTTPPRKET